jgi:hypothetical protein
MKEPWMPGSKTFEMVTLLLPRNAVPKLDGERTPSPGQHPFGNGQGSVRPQFFASLILIFSDDAKETVCFVCDSSGEKDSGILRQKIPQTIKLERRSIGAHKRLDEIARHWIVIVDKAVTEIADPKLVFNQRESPRRAALTAR